MITLIAFIIAFMCTACLFKTMSAFTLWKALFLHVW